jgi:hypothetical protein
MKGARAAVTATRQTADLNRTSLSAFPKLSANLGPPAIDEVRQIDEESFLGMTVVNAGLLRRLPLPFLLKRVARPNDLRL